MNTVTTQANVATAADQRAAFYKEIDTLSMTPLWESLHALVPREPKSPCVPAQWRYKDVRPFLMRSGELIWRKKRPSRADSGTSGLAWSLVNHAIAVCRVAIDPARRDRSVASSCEVGAALHRGWQGLVHDPRWRAVSVRATGCFFVVPSQATLGLNGSTVAVLLAIQIARCKLRWAVFVKRFWIKHASLVGAACRDLSQIQKMVRDKSLLPR